jgi:protein tyrosine/serine phosphatase
LVPLGVALSLAAILLAGLQAAPIQDVSGVPNFHRVDEHVYRGAQPSGEGFAALGRLGVRTVIDLRGETSERAFVERAGMHYVRLPWSGYKAPADSQIAAVLALLNDSSQWPVFVHCRRGADRTGTAIACYRIAHDRWSNQQALDEAKRFGMSSIEVAMQRFILRFAPPPASTAALAAPGPASAPAPAFPAPPAGSIP